MQKVHSGKESTSSLWHCSGKNQNSGVHSLTCTRELPLKTPVNKPTQTDMSFLSKWPQCLHPLCGLSVQRSPPRRGGWQVEAPVTTQPPPYSRHNIPQIQHSLPWVRCTIHGKKMGHHLPHADSWDESHQKTPVALLWLAESHLYNILLVACH